MIGRVPPDDPTAWLSLKNCRVTVMGLGTHGGGAGAVRFLLDRGARVSLTDHKTEAELGAALETVPLSRLERIAFGDHPESWLDATDLLVVNPAVPPAHPFVAEANRRTIPIVTEIVLFWLHNPAPIVGVTGTVGKSTVVRLLGDMLTAGSVPHRIGGNFGGSLLNELPAIKPEDRIVLELSSYQLTHLDRWFMSPEIGVVTNCSPNHLDWHGCFPSYRAAKQTLFRWQSAGATAIVNLECSEVRTWPTVGRRIGYGSRNPMGQKSIGEQPAIWMEANELTSRVTNTERCYPLSGSPFSGNTRSASNAMAAVVAAETLGLSEAVIGSALQSYRGLPHRCEELEPVDGRRIFDDSKATTPAAVRFAIESMPVPPILLLGGQDRGMGFGDLLDFLRGQVRECVLFGPAGHCLAELWNESEPTSVSFSVAGNLREAVQLAWNRSGPGDVLLLSPGCPSFDEFADFQARGNHFREQIRAIAATSEQNRDSQKK